MTMQGEELKEARERAGLTQGQLADALGLTGTFIGMMERGEKGVEVRTELALRHLLAKHCPDDLAPPPRMRFGVDRKGQNYLEWNRAAEGQNGYARAWISHRSGEKDWAGTGRYLNAARIDALGGGPSGNGADFPIYSDLDDRDILQAFVVGVSSITGNKLLIDPV